MVVVTRHSTVEGPVRIDVGELSATFSEGDLFDVRWGGVEVIQRLYLAVRDEAWNTIPARFTNLSVTQAESTATVDFDAFHEHESIRYSWHGAITARASGTLAYEMRGRALQDFRYSKIGFNVHHGLRSHAGRTFRLRALDGDHQGIFGDDLEPQLVKDGTLTAMTPHFDRLDIALDGVDVAMIFDGDRFEMQDHRNWIDANWKTYGTPLEFGFPMDISSGAELYQRVSVAVSGPGRAADRSGHVQITDEAGPAGTLPRIGHVLTAVPDDAQLEALRILRPDHVRVDLHPGAGLTALLAAAQGVADVLGAGLEVAVFLRPDHAREDASALAAAMAQCTARVDRLLVLAEVSGFSAFRGACPPEVSDHLRAALAASGVGIPAIVSGTSQFFVDINRDRPDYSGIDGIVFAVNPQVHASDDRSIMQNAQAISDVVDFARRLYGDIDVVMSPVDLIGANGPYPAGPGPHGGRPANEDARQSTGFCAAWTLAALAEMARCRTTSATLFDLVGPRGLLTDPGEPYPVARLLAGIAELAAFPLEAVASGDPDRIAVMAFRRGGVRDFLLGNLTDGSLTARLPAGAVVEVPAFGILRVSDGDAEQ